MRKPILHDKKISICCIYDNYNIIMIFYVINLVICINVNVQYILYNITHLSYIYIGILCDAYYAYSVWIE